MPFSEAPLSLTDILDAIVAIEQFTQDMDLDSFRQDLKTIAAVERKLQIISEAAVRLGLGNGLLLRRDVLGCFAVPRRSEELTEDPGELTIAACSGCASGTLIASMRKSDVLGSFGSRTATQPGSSVGERGGAEPEM